MLVPHAVISNIWPPATFSLKTVAYKILLHVLRDALCKHQVRVMRL